MLTCKMNEFNGVSTLSLCQSPVRLEISYNLSVVFHVLQVRGIRYDFLDLH
jgi:hypothetical protein